MGTAYTPLPKIETDLEKFQERVLEITNNDDYDKIKHTVSELKKVLYSDKDFVALCAPQIGTHLRMFIVKTSGKNSEKFKVFLNPMIIQSEGLHLSRETNPSFPGKTFIIPRKDKIHLAYQMTDGVIQSETYLGAYAEVIQQMVEMLDGITLEDYGLQINEDFDNASDDDKQKIINMYLDSLKLDSKNLTKEIEEDENLKAINDTINFMTGMIKGDIKPLDKDGNEVDWTKNLDK